jgi:hypothetical protein
MWDDVHVVNYGVFFFFGRFRNGERISNLKPFYYPICGVALTIFLHFQFNLFC